MYKKFLMLGSMLWLLAGGVQAQTQSRLTQVPLDDGGLLALAAAGIAVGIAVARSKRK